MKQAAATIQEYELPITLHEEDGAYLATCPLWEDCYAQGDTIEEKMYNEHALGTKPRSKEHTSSYSKSLRSASRA